MQQEQTGANSASFAGLLAALTAARQQAAGDGPAAPDGLEARDGLEDDVATLSYERALQTHARYKPVAAEDSFYPTAPTPETHTAPRRPSHARLADAKPARVPRDPVQSRKDASITVRMSRAECAQLQQRAMEAGMTISAYLRSCTLEVETLRAQVKQTLAELRAAPSAPAKPRLPWLRRLRSGRHSGSGASGN